jgi:Fe-S oxidoreductase
MYKRYILIRGKQTVLVSKLVQTLFVWYKKILYPSQARFMEMTPTNAKVLLYPGCYVYSPKTMKKTITLLDHIGESYSILGGVRYCCGLPHLLQGEFDQAEQCMNQVYAHIKKSGATTVITGCLECYQALQIMMKNHNDSRKVLTVVEYLMNHKKEFPSLKLDHTIALLPSCRHKTYAKAYATAKKAVKHHTSLNELDPNYNWCCRKWNHDHSHANAQHQKQLLKHVEDHVTHLACECLTCYETLNYLPSSVQVIELIDLFYHALQGEKQ